ncbi:hypothetical protein GGR27_003388 [Lewinella antarctica]|uniref:Exostosin GT47 domain-containing protein n=1 Tax=Neolewinella antarctica TaxID=442734 RepID=A0ABX0XEY6_9BACT|nr:hypothetical protein [Neolewinella antarctica]
MRLFEAMRAARVPVVIADDWVRPPFVDWSSCCIMIKENSIGELPQILRKLESRAEQIARNARSEWERVFGEENFFHHTVEAYLLILRAREKATTTQKLSRYAKVVRAPYGRMILRTLKDKVLGR